MGTRDLDTVRLVGFVGTVLAYLGIVAVLLTTLSAVRWPDALSFMAPLVPDLDLWWPAAAILTFAGLCLGTGRLLAARRAGSHKRR